MRNFVVINIIGFLIHPLLFAEGKKHFGICNQALGSACYKLDAVLNLADMDEHGQHPETALAIYKGVCAQNDLRGCREFKRLQKERQMRSPCTFSLSKFEEKLP